MRARICFALDTASARLRRGLVHGAKAWNQAHRRWLRSLSFEHEADRAVFDDYLQAIEYLQEKLRGLEEKLVTVSAKDPYREPVGWLRCFRRHRHDNSDDPRG
jgi:hypothetical protein